MGLAIEIAYDGTDFHGFQRQPGGVRTVQGELESLFHATLGAGEVRGAARTDAGVHAAGQVIYWTGPCSIPLDRVALVLAQKAPADIDILRVVSWADADWHPRRAAVAKEYRYRLWLYGQGPCRLPWRRYTYRHPRPLDVNAMRRAATVYVGEHDFRAFRNEGSSAKTTVRTVYAARFAPDPESGGWQLAVVANGFLYHMVRRMMGALILVGEGAGPSLVREYLTHPLGPKVRFLAPAQGLVLQSVALSPDPFASHREYSGSGDGD